MLTLKRPLQGLLKGARINWYYYLVALVIFIFLLLIKPLLSAPTQSLLSILQVAVFVLPMASLMVSLYINDFSRIYRFDWINREEMQHSETIVNINAGFNKSSDILKSLFPGSTVHVLDFYNPGQHTDPTFNSLSEAYPAVSDTIHVNTSSLPLPSEAAENIFLIFAANRVKSEKERTAFFKELHRTLSYSGKIIFVEHLRDLNNFLAYNIEFLRFAPRAGWMRVFDAAGLAITQEKKVTPFVTIFTLEKQSSCN